MLIVLLSIWFIGALCTARWVWNSLPECKEAAKQIAATDGWPLWLIKILLPAVVIGMWPITIYVVWASAKTDRPN